VDRDESRASRAIALVRSVAKAASEPRGTLARVAARPLEGILVKGLHATSELARQLARVDIPGGNEAQKATLAALAAELRATAAKVLVSPDVQDRETVDGALAETVQETLHLVDTLLRERTALPSKADAGIEVREGDGSKS
jgi:hypothetical protein